MPKKKETAPVVEKVSDPRQAAWEKHLASYEESNPVKFAVKKANGEFDKIPANFVGGDELKNLTLQEMPGK